MGPHSCLEIQDKAVPTSMTPEYQRHHLREVGSMKATSSEVRLGLVRVLRVM